MIELLDFASKGLEANGSSVNKPRHGECIWSRQGAQLSNDR
jgi:hypothetical protein